MRANASMLQKLTLAGINPEKPQAKLGSRLRALAEAAVVNDGNGCCVLAPLASSIAYDPVRYHDRTGYEAMVNKIHVSDYFDETPDAQELLRQGIAYANKLSRGLRTVGSFVTILSADQETGDVVVRFHTQRLSESWLAEDLEAYRDEDILIWEPGDVANHVPLFQH